MRQNVLETPSSDNQEFNLWPLPVVTWDFPPEVRTYSIPLMVLKIRDWAWKTMETTYTNPMILNSQGVVKEFTLQEEKSRIWERVGKIGEQ